ncbi:heme o synthase [Candidatus Aquiluna sp. UB-MaderosW2red]|uniref:heme o synthase n=1 Tax=Candidatus Aquiluna sp. UB-MaderosW2red TaxID=1855377 RepID=UPI000875ED7D|nr:heme o synthase [Candidatus Aquiluna sp. UB-MaderosW2red]SCX12080.1 protoheme IX farnesyltransferase [Candidatus Aquiluna sp. UB-MaderosW2red]
MALDTQTPARRSFLTKLRAYFALTKPRVIELLLIATVPTMILAAQGIPSVWLVLATLVGGALSAGSANSFNCYIDRDIDKVMNRTKKRPLVTGELTDKEALRFAWALGVISIIWLAVLVNPLSAVLSLIAILFYVFVYTLGLKRRTPQNIVWGGAAGAVPVLIGWAAVTNEISPAAWVLFFIIFLWTPPHYWPLSMRYLEDYKKAGVPMLPVVAKNELVGRQIILYAWAYLAATLLLIPVANMGLIYSITAVVAGTWFTWESHKLYNEARVRIPQNPMRLFHGSITHLTLLFLAIAIDPLLYFSF